VVHPGGIPNPATAPSQPHPPVRSDDERERDGSDEKFADGADGKRSHALVGHLADVGAQTDAGEGQQECPFAQVRQAGDVLGLEC
jgi:hypothetical protein